MLIDESAGSQAETGALAVEMANGTKFVGSPTAGQDGSVTFFSIPGGIRVSFSGTEFRHADGRCSA
jgi:C-terminal processing protease CtpA/Prc